MADTFCLLTFTWEAPAEPSSYLRYYQLKIDGRAQHRIVAADEKKVELHWPRGRKIHAELYCIFQIIVGSTRQYDGKAVALDIEIPLSGADSGGPMSPPFYTQVEPNLHAPTYERTCSWESFLVAYTDKYGTLSEILTDFISTTVTWTSPDFAQPVVLVTVNEHQTSQFKEFPFGSKVHQEVVYKYAIGPVNYTLKGAPKDFGNGPDDVPANFSVNLQGVCKTNFVRMIHSGFIPHSEYAPGGTPSEILCQRVLGTNTYYGVGGPGSVKIDDITYYGQYFATVTCSEGNYWGYSFLRITKPGPPAGINVVMFGYIPSTALSPWNVPSFNRYVSAADWPGPDNGSDANIQTSAWEGGDIIFI